MRLAAGKGGKVELKATLMLGTALVFAGDYAEGAQLVERCANGESSVEPQFGAYVGAGLAVVGQDARARTALQRVIDQARTEGAVAVLPFALVRLAGVELDTGRWADAATALSEAIEIAQQIGQSADHGLGLGTLAWLEAAQGRAESSRAHVQEALALAGRLGSGSRIDRAAAALGLLHLGCGEPESAIPHLQDVRGFQEKHGWSDAAVTPHRTPDLVEAYAMAGRPDEAITALAPFASAAHRIGRASAQAAVARCRALLAGQNAFDALFAEALDASEEVTGPFERARSQLLYGARLATENRHDEATRHLVPALAVFERLGAEPWAERARDALRRAGAVAPLRKPRPLDQLTARELEIALAVARGTSSEEIGELQLIGPRTARRHLISAMLKLRLESSAQLAGALGSEAPTGSG